MGKRNLIFAVTAHISVAKHSRKKVRKIYNMKPDTGTFVIQDVTGKDGIPTQRITRKSKD